MHFAFVLYRFFPHGGLQKDFLRTCYEALGRGHRVTAVFAEQEADLPEHENLSVVKLPVRGFSNHRKMRSFAGEVQKFIGGNKFDKVLMFNRMPGGDLYFAADDCLAEGYYRKYPAWLLKLLPRYRTFLELEKSVFDNSASTHILALTEKQIAAYCKFYQTLPQRFTLMPPGIDAACRLPEDPGAVRRKIRSMYNIADDAALLIQVAAQFEIKGVDRSIAALASLPESWKNRCVLLIAGGGAIAEYQAVARKYDVEKQVIFCGAVSNIHELLAAADLMIHPARKEATGTVLVEALALGVPAIASGICGYAFYCGKLDEKLVLAEPFSQKELDLTLLYSLDNLEKLTRAAAKNINHPDFYRRTGAMVDLLEK